MSYFDTMIRPCLLDRIRATSDVWLYKGEVWEYEEVVSPTGRIWMDRNLGASRAATVRNDSQSYGDYFQWGRLDDLHQNSDSATINTQSIGDIPGHGDFIIDFSDWRNPSNDNLWSGGLNVPAPPGWRVPTEAEWLQEIDTWGDSGDPRDDAFNSILKMPVAGFRQGSSGTFFKIGNRAYIHSMTSVNGTTNIRMIYIDSGNKIIVNGSRSDGRPVRLIKEI